MENGNNKKWKMKNEKQKNKKWKLNIEIIEKRK